MNEAELAEAGRRAAQKVWRHGVRADVEDPLEPAFAKAAVSEFGRLQVEDTPGIYRDVLEGAARGAEQLDIDRFHGVVEVLQNADDAGATRLRLAVRARGRKKALLFVHDGEPILLPDLIAMTLAFVSTKTDEAFKKGRFGIGLKTLRALGSTLRVHSGPYHASISLAENRLSRCEPAPPIKGLFRPSSGETLIELDLEGAFDARALKTWLASVDVSSLLFLDSVRSVTLAGARSTKASLELALEASPPKHFEIKLGRQALRCEEVELTSKDGRSWRRYAVERPVPKSAPRRRHKRTADVTPLGIAVPDHEEERGRVFAGLPLATAVGWPFSVNAQFDVDTPRTGVRRGEWNDWLLSRVIEAIIEIARHRFGTDPSTGWAAIPLKAEVEDVAESWFRGQLMDGVEDIQRRAFRGLTFDVDGQQVRIRDFMYESKELERLMSTRDLQLLGLDAVPLGRDHRDPSGRWREVLQELGEATEVDVFTALGLLRLDDEELGHRSVNWFIRFARIAISAGEGDELRTLRSIVLKDGGRVMPPAPGAHGEVLLRRTRRSSLAFRLGMARVIHGDYLSRNPEAAAVRRWLESNGILAETAGDMATLQALAHRGSQEGEAVKVSDDDLLDLRTALMRLGAEERGELGAGIGAAIAVDGFSWARGRQSKRSARPADSYLPRTLEDRTDGWAAAARHTPDLTYVAARYATVLRRGSRESREPGAARFFRILGCEVAPHLRESEDVEHRHGEPANPIDFDSLTESQLDALGGAYVSHTQGDRLSPDLKRVVHDIGRDRSKKRRGERARALILTLDREWDRLFAEHTEARAVVSSYNWIEETRMPASWLAAAIDTAWLNDSLGQPAQPRDLVLRTPATEAMHGAAYESYAVDLDAAFTTSPVVRALRITTDPRVSEIVKTLAEMRSEPLEPNLAELHARYLALNGAVRRVDASPDDAVGDLNVRQLRARFGADPRQQGVIFTRQGWRRPREVFRGPELFGDRRAFVPEPKRAERLWRVLNIRAPGIEACVSVLNELARHPPTNDDQEILCNIYSHLESLLPDATPKSLLKLASVPLWTGSGWTRKRPVFAVDDEELARSLGTKITLWRSPLSPDSLGDLLGHLDVTLLGDDRFDALVDETDLSAGEPYRERFAEAVVALRSDLARNDRDLYRGITVPWDELVEAEIALAPGLQVKLGLPNRKELRVPARAHLSTDPLRMSVWDVDEIGARAVGGRAIAALFPAADRHKAAMAWAAAWIEAAIGDKGGRVKLAEEPPETDVEDLYRQASEARKAGKPRKARGKRGEKARTAAAGGQPTPPVKRLKSIDDLVVTSVERPPGTGSRKARGKRGLRKDLPSGKTIGDRPAPRGAVKAYSTQEQQHLALLALNKAINGELSDLRDFQHLRGVGADALDRLKRFFEIKSSAGPISNLVDVTINEYRRAVEERGKFYLAIVAGLEVGYETVVRIIPNPASSLEVRRSPDLTLSGVLAVDKPIEVRFG